MRSCSKTLYTLFLVAVAVPPRASAAITPPPIGDFDGDGRSNTAADYAAYIRSFGILFRTYGVTNDRVFGIGLPRRDDGQISMISDHCLTAGGIPGEPIPVQNLPGMGERLATLAALPPQYLREYGRTGGMIAVFEDYGRVAKTWRIETIGA